MEPRSHESPMDFQWDNPRTPAPSSPFSMINVGKTVDDNSRRRAQAPSTTSPTRTPFSSSITEGRLPFFPTSAKGKAPSSIFQTPASLRIPLFKSPLQLSLITPRKYDTPLTNTFSPATEPESSPEHSTEDTPELLTKSVVRVSSAHKDTLMTPTEKLSGRGEIKRGKVDHPKRVVKRRSKIIRENLERNGFFTAGRHSRHGSYTDTDHEEEDDEDYSDASAGRLGAVPPAKSANIFGKSKWDHHFPVLASEYLQLFLNIFIVGVILYCVIFFLRTVQADVDQKVEQYSQRVLQEMAECKQQYYANRCTPALRVPKMEEDCNAWERCMQQDPAQVGRAKVSAQTFAEILNSLIEPISYKAMFFCLFLVFGSLAITNTAFGLYRSKVSHHPPPPPTYLSVPPMPAHHPVWATPHTNWDIAGQTLPSSSPAFALNPPKTPSRRQKLQY